MYQKTFVCLCRQTISRITVHAMSDMNSIYQFQDIWRIFTRVIECGQRQTHRQRQTECINTFKLCWKVLKSEAWVWLARVRYFLKQSLNLICEHLIVVIILSTELLLCFLNNYFIVLCIIYLSLCQTKGWAYIWYVMTENMFFIFMFQFRSSYPAFFILLFYYLWH